MIFQVTRTSLWGEKPWDRCIPIQLTRVDTRTFRTSEEFDTIRGKHEGKWLENGTNHRVNADGYITRDMELKNAWGYTNQYTRRINEFQKGSRRRFSS